MDPQTACGPVWLPGDAGCVDPVRGDQCHRHPLIPAGLNEVGPDLALIRRMSGGRESVGASGRSAGIRDVRNHEGFMRGDTHTLALAGVWSLLDFDLEAPAASRRLDELALRCEAINGGASVRALLVQPLLDTATATDATSAESSQAITSRAITLHAEQSRCLRLTLPLQQHSTLIREQVEWALQLT